MKNNHSDGQISVNSQHIALYQLQTQVLQEGPILLSETYNKAIFSSTYNKVDIVNRMVNLITHNIPQPRNCSAVMDTSIVHACRYLITIWLMKYKLKVAPYTGSMAP